MSELLQKILNLVWSQTPVRGLRRYSMPLVFNGIRKTVTFIEQNPNKGSEFATRARNGEKVVWGFVNGRYAIKGTEKDGLEVLWWPKQ